MSDTQAITLTPLGGLGEIGMNCMLITHGDNMVMVDCGLQFPDESLFGVDVVIPRFEYVLANKHKLRGIVLTHGHEDHIGALPWLLPYVDVPLYGSAFTLALARKKLTEHGLTNYVSFNQVAPRDRLELGPFAFQFFPVCHSIIQSYALGIETPAGRLFHTGDFKFDPDPIGGTHTDIEGIRAFCEQGVLLMLSDSTNVEREGHSANEREIIESLRQVFAEAKGRIVLTLFSSHIQRIQEILDLAHADGRPVAVYGKSLCANIAIARELGFLHVPRGLDIRFDEAPAKGQDRVVLLVTGSQGEPLSALSKLAQDEHRHTKVRQGDTVIMSSRVIPGNTRAISRLINRLYKLGAEVINESFGPIHASGHGYQQELTTMLQAVKPHFFVPVHGEYRHLVKHRKLALSQGVPPERAIVLENGHPLTLRSDKSVRLEESIEAEGIYVDGKGVGDVGATVLKERALLAGEGLVIVLLVVDEATGEIILGPNIISKGFVFEQHYSHLLEDAQCVVLDLFETIPPGATEKLKERLRSGLRRFFRKVLERDPVVVPIVLTL